MIKDIQIEGHFPSYSSLSYYCLIKDNLSVEDKMAVVSFVGSNIYCYSHNGLISNRPITSFTINTCLEF